MIVIFKLEMTKTLSGLQSGEFDDIDVFHTITVNGEAGANNQVLTSDGDETSWQDVTIANGSVGTNQLAPNAVTTDKLADNSLENRHLTDGAVDSLEIADGAVTATKIGAGAVTATKIGAGAVTAGKIAADAVGEDQLQTDAVIAVKIKDGEVTAAKIGAGAVTAGKIGAGAVTATKIGDDAVGEDQLAADAVFTDNIKDGQVTNDKLAGGINYAKILASSIPAAPTITSLTGLTNVESSLYSAPAMTNAGKGAESGGYLLTGTAIGTTTPSRNYVLYRDANGFVKISVPPP
jgi:hypothetical protein